MTKVILNGYSVEFDACVALMDDEIREDLHINLDKFETDEEFLHAYINKHYEKFNEDFSL